MKKGKGFWLVLPLDLFEVVSREAKALGVSRQSLIAMALSDWLYRKRGVK